MYYDSNNYIHLGELLTKTIWTEESDPYSVIHFVNTNKWFIEKIWLKTM